MDQPTWKPLFRSSGPTITKVLRSPAFSHARAQAFEVMADAGRLRGLADAVEALDYDDAPLSAVRDRVEAAVRLLRAEADGVERDGGPPPHAADEDARERLLVAALLYLVTPVDLIPDFHAGGYLDDVLALTWVFGTAAAELEPYLLD